MHATTAAAIRHHRLRRGLSQAALARLAGVNRLTVLRHETGARTPDVEVLGRYASALGLHTSSLLPDPPAVHTSSADAAPPADTAPLPSEGETAPNQFPTPRERHESAPLRLAAADHPCSRERGAGRHAGGAKRRRSAAALEREVDRLERGLRRAERIETNAYARCVISGSPMPPDPPGIGARHRAAWERARERTAEVRGRLEAARTALAEAQVVEGARWR